MKKLILTGWGWKDYGVAAAVALRHHRQADVLGMSTRRLPGFLHECVAWKEIVIIGVGLVGNPALLEAAVKKQAAKGVALTWISALPPPEEIGPASRAKMKMVVADDCLTAVVGKHYRVEYADLLPVLAKAKRGSAVCDEQDLLEAAMYVYRNDQDEAAYGRVIRRLAAPQRGALSLEEKNLLAHYRRYGAREIVGKSRGMRDLLGKIKTIAAHENARVLIVGESGTGKETVAMQIHTQSARRKEPFIAFNCANVAPALLESRFFGHEKGAFTGAVEQKQGIFEQADGGTLFLDEIGELPLEAQGLLLRVLEGGRFWRVGEKEEVVVDVRLITATNRNLAEMVRNRTFREDLYHRLNVLAIRVPPLREHKEDVEAIANSYLLKRGRPRLTAKQLEALLAYDYPGNVRELFNLLERATVLAETNFTRLLAEHKQMTGGEDAVASDVPENLAAMTRAHVRRIFEKYDGNQTRAAAVLGISRATLRKHLDT